MGYHWTFVFFKADPNLELKRSLFRRRGEVRWKDARGPVVNRLASGFEVGAHVCRSMFGSDGSVAVPKRASSMEVRCEPAIFGMKRLSLAPSRQKQHPLSLAVRYLPMRQAV